ncbi:hypothetical protein [Kineococcus terrestris]|uniref:hypothetical protein n=1 Tax=Kineococcus terrestris TaxID=2044856 RepID=UPI0034DB1772
MPTNSDDLSSGAREEGDTPSHIQLELGLDRDLVEKIKAEALIQAGHSVTDDDGNVRSSTKQLQIAVLQIMQDKHVVTTKRELASRSVTAFELYQEMLPQGPGAQSLAQIDEEKIAQTELTKLVWGFTNVGISGFVQKHVASLGFILCEAGDVARTKINQETGKKQPTTEHARFLTSDRDLIMTYYTGPAGASFLRAARKLEAQLGLVADRRPELAGPVARQLGTVVKQAVTSIPHADVKAVAALKGSNDGTTETA